MKPMFMTLAALVLVAGAATAGPLPTADHAPVSEPNSGSLQGGMLPVSASATLTSATPAEGRLAVRGEQSAQSQCLAGTIASGADGALLHCVRGQMHRVSD